MLMTGSGFGFLMVLAGFSTLIMLISLAALGVMIYFWVQPGDAGDNQVWPGAGCVDAELEDLQVSIQIRPAL